MSTAAISLDDLLALSAEIAALARAGVPLEQGLAALGRDMPGRLGTFANELGQRTARGESLPDALAAAAGQVPGVYGAVVTAGLRAGRLPAALESLAHSARRMAETRRNLILMALYPLLLLAIIWGFVAFFAGVLAPALYRSFQSLGVPGAGLFRTLAGCGRGACYWGPAGPIVLVLLAVWWWYLTSRAMVVGSQRRQRLLLGLPWLGRMMHWSRAGTFVEILALLVEQGVPLHEAIRLAADASGDAQLHAAAEAMAAAAAAGQLAHRPDVASAQTALTGGRKHSPPPILLWLMGGRQNAATLAPALRHAADSYHRRAEYQSELARVLLPVVLTLGVGGGLTAMYAFALFVPYFLMLKSLAMPG
jgi:type II secretory pathway component PulF